jgi:hypothetical protein
MMFSSLLVVFSRMLMMFSGVFMVLGCFLVHANTPVCDVLRDLCRLQRLTSRKS